MPLATFTLFFTLGLIITSLILMFHKNDSSKDIEPIFLRRYGNFLLDIGLIMTLSWELQKYFFDSFPAFLPALLFIALLGSLLFFILPDWHSWGVATFFFLILSTCSFFLATLHSLLPFSHSLFQIIFSSALLILQFVALLLSLGYAFEMIDTVCRTRWRRRITGNASPSYDTPKVSLHLPIHNEPPDMVIQTLDALARLAYPDFEVIVVDNNTSDENIWRPVEIHCQKLGSRFRFFHVLPLSGYKAGALNFALSKTCPDAKIVGVIDSDYVVSENYLADIVPLFQNGKVGFVQTPQDYRNVEQTDRYQKALYLSYQYFFKISMASRNEYNGIIYAGTMGLILKDALIRVGGWNEWCITEDAEMSLRLLSSGYESIFVDTTYGRGFMPDEFGHLKKQRYRWAFGGIQILRLHIGKLLFPSSQGGLSFSQRWSYLFGGFQWIHEVVTFGFTLLLLIGSLTYWIGLPMGGISTSHQLFYLPILFSWLGMIRFLWALSLRSQCTWKESLDALIMTLSLSWIVNRACIQGFFSKKGSFFRTPKQAAKHHHWIDFLRISIPETFLGISCFIFGALLLFSNNAIYSNVHIIFSLLLLWHAFIYLSYIPLYYWSSSHFSELSLATKVARL